MKLNEAIYNGLTNLGAFIKEAKQDQIEHEQSIYRTGWLSDSEKLRLLKYDLYSSTSARGDEKHLRQLRQTITLLSKEVQAEHRRRYSLPNQLNQIAKAVIGLLVLATVGSYAIHLSNICNGQNSKFCRDSRFIPTAIEGYFHNETINPNNINTNIDQSN